MGRQSERNLSRVSSGYIQRDEQGLQESAGQQEQRKEQEERRRNTTDDRTSGGLQTH